MREFNVIAEPEIKEYYSKVIEKTIFEYNLANSLKKGSRDISQEVEVALASDLADRAETLVGPKGVAKRFRELVVNEPDRMKVIFQIFREILEEKWVKIPDVEKRLELAIKCGLVIMTEGVVVAPIQGIPQVKISKNPDGSKYVDIYFAGPIRAAGGTAQVLPLLLGNYAMEILGLDRYKPTQDEIERYVEEIDLYNTVQSRQYVMKDKEVRIVVSNCPVCINGVPTEEIEVSLHRDIARVPSNNVRGAMALVLSEGLALKAEKLLKLSKLMGLDWSWLEQIIKAPKDKGEKTEIKPIYKFLEGIAAGRAIFSYPMAYGGFRLRYGRSRNTGIMAKGIHPASMYLLGEFIAVDTQLKIERPGKSAGMFPVDSIEGPIVLLKSKEVLQLKTKEEVLKHKDNVEKILFVGDMLVAYGDFRKTAHPLIPVGYCEEWWYQELLEKNPSWKGNYKEIDFETSVSLSEKYSIPLHPFYIYYYKGLEPHQLKKVLEHYWDNSEFSNDLLIIKNSEEIKKYFEKMGIPHKFSDGNIILEKDVAKAISFTFSSRQKFKSEDTLGILSEISGLQIKDKIGTFIGARMGRPEASKPRKMDPAPHGLFPIGFEGGNSRLLNKAYLSGKIETDLSVWYCSKCKKIIGYHLCDCGEKATKYFFCEPCRTYSPEHICPKCGKEEKILNHKKQYLPISRITDEALSFLGVQMPEKAKGVKGLFSKMKIAEPVEKLILRARYDISVFKDGTIRLDSIDAVLTHFYPFEIGTSVEKLKELGYTKDVEGKELVSDTQLIELFPQDIILHDESVEFFLSVSKFIDDEIVKFYKGEAYYNCEKKEDLIGHYFIGLAPHTSAGISCRLIGFTKARCCYGHPYFQQVKRRNVDGDQDGIILQMDAFLNFSKSYFGGGRGADMDAPVVLTVALEPKEVDDECHEMDIVSSYPLELYRMAEKITSPYQVKIRTVSSCLDSEKRYTDFFYTHTTSVFDNGPKQSTYTKLHTMIDKMHALEELQGKISAVDAKDALERVISSHFMPDIVGNARGFARQVFRCTTCQTKYRRPPLSGVCESCGNSTIILTIAQGSIRKYLEVAKDLVQRNNLSSYLHQRLQLIEDEINHMFKPEIKAQKSLFEFS